MAKKRSNGEGSVRCKKSGRWVGQIMDGYTDDGKRKIITFFGATKGETLDKIRDFRNQESTNLSIDKKLKLEDWADTWYADYRTQVQPSTYSGYGVETDHASAIWDDWSGVQNLTHAYAITIHKSQGSEYDTVIIPVHKNLGKFMYRNLLYTAISRAKKKVILVGDPDALGQSLRTPTPERKSVLVAQTNMKIHQASQKKEAIA